MKFSASHTEAEIIMLAACHLAVKAGTLTMAWELTALNCGLRIWGKETGVACCIHSETTSRAIMCMSDVQQTNVAYCRTFELTK